MSRPGSEHVARKSRGQHRESRAHGRCRLRTTPVSSATRRAGRDESARGEVLRLAGGLQRGAQARRLLEARGSQARRDGLLPFRGRDSPQESDAGQRFRRRAPCTRRGITCFNCHDVHGTGNYAQLIKPANTLCMDCHGPSSPNGPHATSIETHTHHKTDSEGSQCVACHMPAIETEGVPGAYVHAHTFKVITPQMTKQCKVAEPVHVVSQRQNHGVGHTGDAQLAWRIAVADRIGGPESDAWPAELRYCDLAWSVRFLIGARPDEGASPRWTISATGSSVRRRDA